MSVAAWRLFQKAYADQLAPRPPQACLLLKLAADSLVTIRSRLIGALLGLKYEAPTDEWEELAYWEIVAAQREVGLAFETMDNVRRFLQRRIERRWKLETGQAERIVRMKEDAEDERRVREQRARDLEQLQALER